MKKVVVLGNALGFLVSGGIILKYIYTLMILPFIIKEVTSMTWIGLFVLIIAKSPRKWGGEALGGPVRLGGEKICAPGIAAGGTSTKIKVNIKHVFL